MQSQTDLQNPSIMDLVFDLKNKCMVSELEMMSDAGLSPAEYHGIAALAPEEKISGTEVSKKMNLSPSRASRVIDRMVQKGFLVREIDPSDRRKCTIYLNQKGITLKNQIDRLKKQCESRIRQQLSQPEVDSLAFSLEKLIHIL